MVSKEILGAIRAYPLEKIIGSEIPVKNISGRFMAKCPFHNGELGSFIINGKSENQYANTWHCFAGCGHGDAIDFISKVKGLSWKDSVDYISTNFLHGDIAVQKTQDFEPIETKRSKPIASATVRDKVYRAFIKAAGPMSEDTKKYLKKERALAEEELQDFFDFPAKSDKRFWAVFNEALKAENVKRSALLSVPGFFVNEKSKAYSFMSYKNAIGIKEKDIQGRVTGIQIRLQNGSAKYIAFSSNRQEDWIKGGTAAKTEIDYLLPNAKNGYHNTDIIAITEGKFKGLKLSQFGFYTMNIHGVSNWRSIVPGLKAWEEKTGKKKSVFIFLDADMVTNVAVAKAAKAIGQSLVKEGYKTFFRTWAIKEGKGFDDFINNGGNVKTIQKVEAIYFIEHVLNPLILKSEKKAAPR